MSASLNENVTDHRVGHRSRLRQRFIDSGIDSLLDYEIVELLLTLGTPRKDCKPIAKEAVASFKGLKGVLEATVDELQQIRGIGPSNSFGIKLFQEISKRIARENMPEKIELHAIAAVVEYLKKTIGHERKENFLVLYLDTQNNLIDSKVISIGILNATLVHPREVFEPAVSLRAASVIISHNHPSGDVEPSSDDRAITKQLVETGRMLGIEVRDHVIVSKTDSFSFQQQLLI